MIVNYGGCVINLKVSSGSVDLTDWEYYTNNMPDGKIHVFLTKYIGTNPNVAAPEIQ